MQKVIIDTNIYYSLINISNNEKVKKDLFLNFDKYITSATLIECIIKHRTDLNNLKKIISPLMTQEYKLISIGYIPIENKQLQKIYASNSIDDVKNIINDILRLKILKECEFTRWFLYVIMPITFDILMEVENYKFSDTKKMKEFQQYIYQLFNGNIEFILKKFIDTLSNGYLPENSQEIITDEFYSMMDNIFFVYLSNFYSIQEFDENLKPAELGSKVRECIEKDKFYKLVKSNIINKQNPFSFFSKKKYKDKFEKSLKVLITELNDNFYNTKLTESSIKFIESKIYKIFTSKAKLFKNDIFDLLITISLDKDLYKLLSLDKKFISLIEEIDKDSFDLIVKLGLKS